MIPGQLCVLLCVLLPSMAVGEEVATVGQAAVGTATDLGVSDLMPSLWRLFGALLLVVVLIWGTMWIARRVLKGRMTGASGSDMRVLDRVFLGPRRSIEVVTVGNRFLVVGVTDQSISMLTELSEEDLIVSRETQSPMAGSPSGQPGDLWKSVRRRVEAGLDHLRTSRVNDAHPVGPPAEN
jgi:flagellar protein FliO/FliZ